MTINSQYYYTAGHVFGQLIYGHFYTKIKLITTFNVWLIVYILNLLFASIIAKIFI